MLSSGLVKYYFLLIHCVAGLRCTKIRKAIYGVVHMQVQRRDSQPLQNCSGTGEQVLPHCMNEQSKIKPNPLHRETTQTVEFFFTVSKHSFWGIQSDARELQLFGTHAKSSDIMEPALKTNDVWGKVLTLSFFCKGLIHSLQFDIFSSCAKITYIQTLVCHCTPASNKVCGRRKTDRSQKVL